MSKALLVFIFFERASLLRQILEHWLTDSRVYQFGTPAEAG
jgi:hypothetical protein